MLGRVGGYVVFGRISQPRRVFRNIVGMWRNGHLNWSRKQAAEWVTETRWSIDRHTKRGERPCAALSFLHWWASKRAAQ
jgi:hypothetical protein